MKAFIYKVSLTLLSIVLISCAGGPQKTTNESISSDSAQIQSWPQINVDEFGEGSEIRIAGERLMDSPMGLVQIQETGQNNDSILVIAVHGYQSSGYEWITGLKHMTNHYGSLFFYRYDWTRCPEDVAEDLAASIQAIGSESSYQRTIIFGHSYGGVVVTRLASKISALNVELHVIAAPLAGYPELLDRCAQTGYAAWGKRVRVIQHKTVHAQDGAFRELDVDPQAIDLPFDEVHELPATMDGHRLGHNWSVTWVLDNYIGKYHRL